jgi:hypothetical protein
MLCPVIRLFRAPLVFQNRPLPYRLLPAISEDLDCAEADGGDMPAAMQKVLQHAESSNVQTHIELFPMSQANEGLGRPQG